MIDQSDSLAREGPFVNVAAFFETVLREDSGVLTLVRMIDRVTISTPHSWISSLPPSPVTGNLVVSFRGQGLAGNSGVLSIQPRKPSGETMRKLDVPFAYETSTGMNLNVSLDFVADEEGYYWFDILLDGNFVTTTPLQIVFRPAPGVAEESAEDSADQ